MRYVMIILFITCLTACGDQSTKQAIQSTPLATNESQSTPNTEETPNSAEPKEPLYLAEEDYQGDELEIIKLMNLRMKYLWEENESDYMALIDENSPLGFFPKYKIKEIKLLRNIVVQEQKNIFQAVVSVNEARYDDQEYNYTYVFRKNKEEGSTWKIADID